MSEEESRPSADDSLQEAESLLERLERTRQELESTQDPDRAIEILSELADGARVRRPRRGVDVEVAGDSATVTVRLAARYGAVLPQVAEEVQRHVATTLEQMCGIEVTSVDVAIEELV